MSIEELERAGLLLPREEWGRPPDRPGGRLALLAVGVAAVGGGWLMYLGDGGTLTWAGLGLFLLALAGFTWLSLRGIR